MSLLEAIRAEAEYQKTRPMFEAVSRGFAPFRAGRVDMFIDYKIDYMQDWLVVVIEGSSDVFEKIITRDMYLDPDSFYSEMAEAIFQFYRNRPRIEPEDHIVLGEE